MRKFRSAPLLILLWLILIMTPFFAFSQAPPAPSQSAARAKAESAAPEVISSGPQNIKEKTAIGVFLAWLWLAIVVSIYVLRWKIQEADRVHGAKFYADAEAGKDIPGDPCNLTEKTSTP
jgi:hypothetical protein